MEYTNKDRAEWAERAIEAFEEETGVDREDAVCDLLCDLMDFCAANGIDFANQLRRGTHHFECEVNEEIKVAPEGRWIPVGIICRCPGPDYCEETLRGEPCKGESDGN